MTTTQIFSLCSSVLFLLGVLWTIYRGYIREGYSLVWIAVASGMICLSIFPRVLDWVAGYLGIETPAFALMLFMLGGTLVLILQQSIIISRHNEQIKILAEELSMLRARIRQEGKESGE